MMWNIQTGAREAHFANIVQAPNKCVASTCRPASHQLLLFCSLHACKGWLQLELVGYISKAGRWLQVSAKAVQWQRCSRLGKVGSMVVLHDAPAC